ncbi:MAG TPA: hypothetical protein DCG90_09650 [Sphingobium sp.]|jgi:hypothetical protein|uniref:hypothetical protein n=1 Tax=Sphingobium sp. TaxID=1912891 RepID=UPI000EC6325E|nr:hypothetical protein [Sphingobium sp.]HAF42012.1 hypothetical protein [Sphingobium sp.]
MLYRNFAIATLIAAPLIVLAVQNFLPTPAPAPQAEQVAPPTPPVPVPVAPPVAAPSAPAVASDPAVFGQPIAGAGQPMLAGEGLQEAPPVPPGGITEPDPDMAGTPNGE